MAKNAVRNVVNNATARVNHPPADDTQRSHRPAPPPPAAPREEREIESWLGELRGTAPRRAAGTTARSRAHLRAVGGRHPRDARRGGTTARGKPAAASPQPGNEPTTAIPALGTLPSQAGGPPSQAGGPPDGRGRPRPQNADATTAIPTQPKPDAERRPRSSTPAEEEEPKRRGGGVSAQDLLRREGRL